MNIVTIGSTYTSNFSKTENAFQITTINESFNTMEPFPWVEGHPEDYGFDATKLDWIHQAVENMPYLRSVLIIRHSTLLVEWYFNDGSKDVAFHIHSASKSFTSVLIGIAVKQGLLTNLDQKMLDFFPEYDTSQLDSRKRDITLRHLLTMK
ncbi:MAG: serine hydrolase [Candidatus Hermodarchaeota archaeon]